LVLLDIGNEGPGVAGLRDDRDLLRLSRVEVAPLSPVADIVEDVAREAGRAAPVPNEAVGVGRVLN